MADRKLKLHEIAEDLKNSEGSVFSILHKNLSMIKLCSKWVLHLLTINQKQQCVDDPERCLQLLQRNEFLRKYVTMDEILIHHLTPETNQQSAEWTATGESRLKRPKTQISAREVLASVFWDAQDILFNNYLEKWKTINSEYFITLHWFTKKLRQAQKYPFLPKLRVTNSNLKSIFTHHL